MNVHDSERLSGLLEDAGYVAAPADEQADVVVLQHLRRAGERRQQALRQPRPPRLGQGEAPRHADRRRRLPGPEGPLHDRREGAVGRRGLRHPQHRLAAGAARAGAGRRRRRRSRSSSRSRSSPARCRPSASRRTPPGCRSPSGATTPARSASSRRCAARRRTAGRATILAEIEALVDQGVSEVTLLGQNVNTYGVEFGDRLAFGKLLRACGEIAGLERVRFTSPHPAAFTDDVIAAMAETPNVMPQLHMPLQSGSDRILKAMRRSYRQERYLGIIERVRAAMPDAAITTDIIVGLPRRDRGGLPRDDARRPRGAFLRRLHLPVLQAPGHAGRACSRTRCRARSCRSATSGWSRWSTTSRGRRTARSRARRRADGRRGGGSQGRQHPPALRPRPRQPAGALHAGRPSGDRSPYAPATWSRSP